MWKFHSIWHSNCLDVLTDICHYAYLFSTGSCCAASCIRCIGPGGNRVDKPVLMSVVLLLTTSWNYWEMQWFFILHSTPPLPCVYLYCAFPSDKMLNSSKHTFSCIFCLLIFGFQQYMAISAKKENNILYM